MADNFTFSIVSPKHGTFIVTAPERFRGEIERWTWRVSFNRRRAKGRQFEVLTNVYSGDKKHVPSMRLHQLIWRLSGRPFAEEIDHRDGDSLNNAEDNLRGAARWQNRCNRQTLRIDNSSGFTGVRASGKLWSAQIKANKKLIKLGSFATLEQAVAARRAAADRLHGEFIASDRRAM